MTTDSIRRFASADWPQVWGILRPVFRAGETYAVDPQISEQDAFAMWIEKPLETWVAADGDRILATYYIKANQPGPGSHVCNCGYVVAEEARGQGLAGRLCDHSLEQAVRLGFRAMQYNLVVAANEAAVRAWQSKGFSVAGRLPGAFCHPTLGDTDALVMFRSLASPALSGFPSPHAGQHQGPEL